jgi:hypothetical protein
MIKKNNERLSKNNNCAWRLSYNYAKYKSSANYKPVLMIKKLLFSIFFLHLNNSSNFK